jgi:hypothetical protein
MSIIKRHTEEGEGGDEKREALVTIRGEALSSLTAEGRSGGNSFGLMVADAMAHYYQADLGKYLLILLSLLGD